jgi:U4/U6 small nuclear ribonucleoprotein PRP31
MIDSKHKKKKVAGIEDVDYALVVEANNMCVEIAEEITKISRFIKEKYKKKFPELESLVLNPLDYARVILRIGNEMVIFSCLL